MDSAHTQAEVLQRITKFNTDRNWGQFHMFALTQLPGTRPRPTISS